MHHHLALLPVQFDTSNITVTTTRDRNCPCGPTGLSLGRLGE
jgi:hypothetical protein